VAQLIKRTELCDNAGCGRGVGGKRLGATHLLLNSDNVLVGKFCTQCGKRALKKLTKQEKEERNCDSE
jgi:hypothetical protein